MSSKLLVLTPHPIEGASSRYRALQYLPYLEAAGISCTHHSFLTSEDFRILYQSGHTIEKLAAVFRGTVDRARHLMSLAKYDAVLVHLEVHPFSFPMFEGMLFRSGVPVIYDLDDTIYMPVRFRWLRGSDRVQRLISAARHVITCNNFLRDFVIKHNLNVTVIPTPLDLDRFCPPSTHGKNGRLVVGWIGSHSTAKYLNIVAPVLSRLAKQYDFIFRIVGAGEAKVSIPGVQIEQLPWTMQEEALFFQRLDIGIYPLPDDEFVKGKTGFKTIQYMAVGVPAVVSAVGVNPKLITNGKNGFLASTEQEWYTYLSRLLKDKNLRLALGQGGRTFVYEHFSLTHSAQTMVKIIENCCKENKK